MALSGRGALNKGKDGEREVAKSLNAVLQKVLQQQQWPPEIVGRCAKYIQRNQNQTAVGGCDLTNVFGLAVEVKRQEVLAIEEWWRQTITSATDNREIPVLVYRQNNKKWRVVMYLQNPLPVVKDDPRVAPYASVTVRAEQSWDDFLEWFEQWVARKLFSGEVPIG